LDSAEAINAYNASALDDPRIHRGAVIHLAPKDYQEGATRIPRHFIEGNVVSVDLGRMSAESAARLVDFCSGMLAGYSGWLFRATDSVIILTPVRR
jgi:FtsZ-interacting cell division protein YlmF